MSDHKQKLDAALHAFNQAERAQFVAETGTRWLGLDGPTYLLGDVRVKAFFEDARGRHWGDACLAIESLAGVAHLSRKHREVYRDAATAIQEVTDLWVFTDALGKWNATMVPVEALAASWGYPPPVRLPDGNWARTWLTLPDRTDEQEVAWIARGGAPLHTDGGRL